MKIVFMGTPDFAVPCLERLSDMGFDITGVFSQPDRPRGRGHHIAPTPVKEAALKLGIPVYQPENLRDGYALSKLQELSPELIAVVAYGRILPKDILCLPKHGCVNIHASLLPKLRGAAPIQWSIINGDRETGVTAMFMAEGLDTGDIILQRKTPINDGETAGELFERLAVLGADALERTAKEIKAGTFVRVKQNDNDATYAPMIDKKLACIDFNKTANEICNLIRGLNPAPMAFTKLDGKILKVLAAKPDFSQTGAPGEVLCAKRLLVACKNGAIELLSVRPEGKNPMSGGDFARGRRLLGGEVFAMS